MTSRNPNQEITELIQNTKFESLNEPSLNKDFTIKNKTVDTLSTYSYSNGISDYLKNKFPGLGDDIANDHDKPSDLKIIDESGNVSTYSIVRAQLTDLQDQINEYLTELMKNEKNKNNDTSVED
ncbi:hypothetical protein ACO0SA_002447 [Hanseniaspora valbyensis]